MTDTSYLYSYFVKKSETEQKRSAGQKKPEQPAKTPGRKGADRHGTSNS